MTNATFNESFCSDPTSYSNATVTINAGTATLFYSIPSCLATSTALKNLYASKILLTSWDQLNVGLTTLSCEYCRFTLDSNSASSPSSFDTSTGRVNWDQVWARLPQLTVFQLRNSYMPAVLPSTLPLLLTDFRMQFHLPLLGALPPTLLQNFQNLAGVTNFFTLALTSSGVNGTIPAGFLEPLADKRFTTFQIDFGNNALSGTIPANFFWPLNAASVSTFRFYTQFNRLTGSIPSFPGLWASNAYIAVNLASNALNGTVPALLFSNLTYAYSITFQASGNRLSGTLPSIFFGTWGTTANDELDLDLSDNLIEGTIPSTLLTSSLSTYHVQFSQLSLDFSNNKLNGTIPGDLLYLTNKKRDAAASHKSAAVIPFTANLVRIDFSTNNLTGSIPDSIFAHLINSGMDLTLLLESNKLSGTFPDLLSNILNTPDSLNVDADSNQIWGDAPTFCHLVPSVTYSLISNQLNGSIPSAGLSLCSSLNLALNTNSKLIRPSLLSSLTSPRSSYRHTIRVYLVLYLKI